MTDEGLDLLRQLLARVEQEQHATRTQYRPLRWRRRRETHRNYMRFAPGRIKCR
jgi:hypothetical protein